MTVQSIKMLNGAAGTITPAAVNQWGASLINAGMGREVGEGDGVGWGGGSEISHTSLGKGGFCQ